MMRSLPRRESHTMLSDGGGHVAVAPVVLGLRLAPLVDPKLQFSRRGVGRHAIHDMI